MFSPQPPRRPSSGLPAVGLLLGIALIGSAALVVGGSVGMADAKSPPAAATVSPERPGKIDPEGRKPSTVGRGTTAGKAPTHRNR